MTKYAEKRDRKEAQKKLNINLKEENLNRLLVGGLENEKSKGQFHEDVA